MKNLHLFTIMTLTLTLAVFTGCQPAPPKGGNPKTAKTTDEVHEKHAPGPHEGVIFDFGKWHGEFTVDHKTQEATVYIFGSDEKTPAPITAEKLSLSIKSPQFQIDLKATPQDSDPKGKSSRFVGKHEKFGKEQEFEGTLNGVVDGKPYAGDFKETEHKHDKK